MSAFRCLRLAAVVAVFISIISATLSPSTACAGGQDARRFDPDRHLPVESLVHLHVPSGRALVQALGQTLPGRMATDPEVRAALGDLPQRVRELIRSSTAPLVGILGVGPLELLELLRGEVVFSITGLDPLSFVSVVIAIELGDRREAILGVLDRLTRVFPGPGGEPRTVEIEGLDVQIIHAQRAPPLYHIVLGDHVVLALSRDVLAGIVRAWKRDGAAEGDGDLRLKDNQLFQRAVSRTQVEAPRLRLVVNIGALRSLAMGPLFGSPEGQRVFQILSITGLSSFSWLGYTLGERAGDIEGRVYLQSPTAQRGMIGAVLDGFSPVVLDEAIRARLPRTTTALSISALDAGAVLRALHDIGETRLPDDVWKQVTESIAEVEKRVGLSLEKDLFTLGHIRSCSVSVPPPGGGLIDDQLLLARTSELEPYLRVVEKMAATTGREPREIREGDTSIRCVMVGGVLGRLWPGGAPPGALPVDPGVAVASAPIDDEWSVCSNAPQPVIRYLRYHRRDAGLAADAPLVRELTALGSARVAGAFTPSRLMLALYNTALPLLPARVVLPEPFASEIRLADLPPAEKFLPHLAPGATALSWDGEGISFHGRRVVSGLSGWVLLGATAGGVAGFVQAFRFGDRF